MHDTVLNVCLRICFFKSFVQSWQSVKDAQKDFVYTTVVQVFENVFPTIGAFLTAYIEA
ncbi:hypothetical protein D3C76_1582210 [compost metagenome]